MLKNTGTSYLSDLLGSRDPDDSKVEYCHSRCFHIHQSKDEIFDNPFQWPLVTERQLWGVVGLPTKFVSNV